MVGAMQAALVGVSDLDEALHLFRDVMELKVDRQWAASDELKKAWHLPAETQIDLVDLSCQGYPIGKVRLARYTPTATAFVRRDLGDDAPDTAQDVGPKALDFYVADPITDAWDRIKATGYRARSEPVKHQIADSISEEFLFTGPDGVPILLMVGHRHAPDSMRAGTPHGPFSEIPTISIVAGDLERTRRFYEDGLGLVALTDAETPDEYRDLVSKLTGVPPGSRIHFLLYGAPGEASGKILLVHFFDRTGKRLTGRMQPGHLGFSLLTHETDDLDGLHSWCQSNDAEMVTPPTDIPDSAGAYRVMLVRGPNEEMFEFVERG